MKIKNNVSYEYYRDTYNSGYDGVVPPEFFPMYAAKARYEVSAMLTSDKTEAYTETVSLCMCEIADKLYTEDRKMGVKSESTDGYTVTYTDGGNLSRDIKKIIIRWLGNSGLLYSGVE